MIKNEYVLTDVCENDRDNIVKYNEGFIRKGNKKHFYLEASKEIKRLDTAINLCGLAAHNYYHFTVEILSRFRYISDFFDVNNIPVLVDESIRKYPQYVDLAKCVLGDTEIIYVPKGQRIRCKKVIYPSMNTWMPINVRKKEWFRIRDNVIAESAVLNIREATQKYMKNTTKKYIYLSRRNVAVSRIVNEEEIESLFKKSGFEIVCTEELSYKEQVELFSSAACIVGASGAALTNLVYCNKGTIFGCIIPKEYNFYIYSSIAKIVGCNMLFYNPEICKRTKYFSSDEYHVEMQEIEDYITLLRNLISEREEGLAEELCT